ncbi:HTH-type transcriptional regulator KipR [Siminovitchia terrae]|uniref:IclR family transcriptional regulator n=1 Tax=Siminovitchia terrae TaxID=1914933 RepID=UPI001B1FBA4B|nr:IclR family transcriptional regulator [Siminovitchia terrae]GIN91559.1 HTH-type transcriptional regulator KipR [Siminovitchia terrae]
MNQSVVKALTLLDLFSENDLELTLNELAERSGMPKPTVYRLLSSLEYMGFLTKSKNSIHDVRYQLGIKLLELGGLVADGLELRKSALPHMQLLQSEINETVHLVIRDGDEAVYIEKVESNQAVRLYTRVGRRSPLYLGSGPQLLLAYLPNSELEEIINKMNFHQVAENTIMNKEDLYEKIETIRGQGYSLSYGEQDTETFGISYPIYDHTDHVVAALNVSGPASRFQGSNRKLMKVKTKEAATKISNDLGYMLNREYKA